VFQDFEDHQRAPVVVLWADCAGHTGSCASGERRTALGRRQTRSSGSLLRSLKLTSQPRAFALRNETRNFFC
jgi:hypothetical protein